MSDKKAIMPVDTWSKILQYLLKCPYQDVAVLLSEVNGNVAIASVKEESNGGEDVSATG
jgi:hypothetical protein